jgi:hypothetical protein
MPDAQTVSPTTQAEITTITCRLLLLLFWPDITRPYGYDL